MGFAIVAGGNPNMAAPVTGIAAGTLAVGSTVKLMESGAAVEYLVVNQGIPSNSNLYDSSCDGTWLLRKALHSQKPWNSSNSNVYANSAINTWLNGDFFNTLGSVEQAAVKQIKIPYCVGGGNSTVNSGANGLSVKAFLLGGYELGWTSSNLDNFHHDGDKLECFISGTGAEANRKRIATLNNSPAQWTLRTPYGEGSGAVFACDDVGGYGYDLASTSDGIRPALILSKTALFDEGTMILKGVA